MNLEPLGKATITGNAKDPRYAEAMPPKSPARRIIAALGTLDAATGPLGRLDAARRLREAADELEAAEVEAARRAGATWTEIGACYGLTKQGAQQRFRATHREGADPRPAPDKIPPAQDKKKPTRTKPPE